MTALAEIRVEDHGLFARHNMPCAVCGAKVAVLFLNAGTFEPCWACQDNGWVLTRVRWARLRSWLRGRR